MQNLFFCLFSPSALTKTFTKSIRIQSRISDYFARFVPLRYFDIPYAESALERAYELDVNNVLTCHRLGIFHRMSVSIEICSDYFLTVYKS